MSANSHNLKNIGLKATLPRLKILELFQRADVRHMSAEDVYKALLQEDMDIGLATVYRVLTQFEAAGIVERHHFEGGHSVFEISQGEHHDHIVCVTCGKVLEFHDEIIEERQRSVAASMGFVLTGHALHLYGVCDRPECRETWNQKNR